MFSALRIDILDSWTWEKFRRLAWWSFHRFLDANGIGSAIVGRVMQRAHDISPMETCRKGSKTCVVDIFGVESTRIILARRLSACMTSLLCSSLQPIEDRTRSDEEFHNR